MVSGSAIPSGVRQRHRLAIAGVGTVAERIAEAVSTLPQAALVAASCRTRAKGLAFAERFGCRWYDETASMLDRELPDVCIICTPSGAHLGVAEACFVRRIDVLCEKPLEVTVARVRRMCELAAQAGTRLGGFFPQRYNPALRLLREAAAAGRFGPLALVVGCVPWWRDDAYYAAGRWQGTRELDGGGALMNQAIHTVDAMQWIAAATMPDLPPGANPVEQVMAMTGVRAHDPRRLEVEDTAAAVFRFRGGAIGQLTAATSAYPGSARRLLVAGRDGTAEIIEERVVAWNFRVPHPADERVRHGVEAGDSDTGAAAQPAALNPVFHGLQIGAFLEAREQQRPADIGGEEAGKAVAIIEACYASAAAGRAEAPEPITPPRPDPSAAGTRP